MGGVKPPVEEFTPDVSSQEELDEKLSEIEEQLKTGQPVTIKLGNKANVPYYLNIEIPENGKLTIIRRNCRRCSFISS